MAALACNQMTFLIFGPVRNRLLCVSVLCIILNMCTQEMILYMTFFSCTMPTTSVIFAPLHLHYCAFFIEVFQVQLFLPPMHLFSGLFLTLELEKKKLFQHHSAWMKKCPEVTLCNLSVELLGVQ